MIHTAWCVRCGARFTEAQIAGAISCPKCGNDGVPCDPANDLDVRVNWHELRILGIWAENYAQSIEKNGSVPDATKTIQAITGRLQRQQPGKTPLTLSGEIAGIKAEGYKVETQGIASPQPLPINGPGAVVTDRSRRRFQMLEWTVGEHAISDAVRAVETMGAHPRLTKVVNMLDAAFYELGLYIQDDMPAGAQPPRNGEDLDD